MKLFYFYKEISIEKFQLSLQNNIKSFSLLLEMEVLLEGSLRKGQKKKWNINATRI